MPNWCSNSITVSHTDPAMITKFADACREGKLFETFAPLPTKDGEWEYGTAIETWGTKWDINFGDLEVDSDGLKAWGWFDTAWGPGIAAYDKLVEAGFDVDVEYIESGMCFAGHYVNGEDYCVDYSELFEDENWRDQIDDDAVLAVLECEHESWLQWQQEEESE